MYKCISLQDSSENLKEVVVSIGGNQKSFRKHRSTTSQILTIRFIIQGVRTKNLKATLLFVNIFKTFDSIPQREDGANTICI